MEDSWLSKKAEEIQSFADRKDMKKFHDALKTIYGPKSSGVTPLLSADGSTLLTDKDAIFKRWAEHFNSVLNRRSSVNDNAIKRLPHKECDDPSVRFVGRKHHIIGFTCCQGLGRKQQMRRSACTDPNFENRRKILFKGSVTTFLHSRILKAACSQLSYKYHKASKGLRALRRAFGPL